MNLKVVHGPPLSGKSSYVRERIGPDDIVYDYDEISRAITFGGKHLADRPLTHKYVIDFRMMMLDRLQNEKDLANAWVIVTNLTDRFRSFLDGMKPEYIELTSTKEECLERLERDDMRPDKTAWREVIDKWFGPKEERSGMKTADKQFRGVAEMTALAEQEKMVIEGKAVSFNSPTVMYEIGGVKYFEQIDRGAFDGCDMKDACLKYNHDDSTPILARVRGGSLQLTRRDDGLYFRAELFNTSFGRDCYELVKQDALQCSFAFTIADGGEEYDKATRTKTITKINRLFDLAIVSLPAYSDTYVKQARSFFEAEAERERAEARHALELALARYKFTEVT